MTLPDTILYTLSDSPSYPIIGFSIKLVWKTSIYSILFIHDFQTNIPEYFQDKDSIFQDTYSTRMNSKKHIFLYNVIKPMTYHQKWGD